MNKRLVLISSEQRGTFSPLWDNLGEIYFRGTLKDLDAAFLEVKLEDMGAPKIMRVVGSMLLPLRGVVDYPFMQAELGSPSWLSLKAKIENWWRVLNEWSFGKLDGKVLILNTPRYRQIGEMHEEYGNRVQLVIRIEDVDQIITPDNR